MLPFSFYKERVRLTDSETFEPSFGKLDFRSIFVMYCEILDVGHPNSRVQSFEVWLWKDAELVCFDSQMNLELTYFDFLITNSFISLLHMFSYFRVFSVSWLL